MRVRVKPDLVETFVGFYGNKRRRPGDEFTLVDAVRTVNGKEVVIQKAEDAFSDKWMERVEEEKPKKKALPKKSETPKELDI